MLDIAASYHCMQCQEKLMNQTWENGKKHILGPDFHPFGPNLGPKTFFRGIYIYLMLEIVAGCICMHFQGKPMN